jgi:hypothetical protein
MITNKEKELIIEAFIDAALGLNTQQKGEAESLALLLFEAHSQFGIPPEIVFDKKEELKKEYDSMPKLQKFWLIRKFLGFWTKHKLDSGMKFDSKSHQKLQEFNCKKELKFMETGEFEML